MVIILDGWLYLTIVKEKHKIKIIHLSCVEEAIQFLIISLWSKKTFISNYQFISSQRENYVFLMKLFSHFRDLTYTTFMGQDWKIARNSIRWARWKGLWGIIKNRPHTELRICQRIKLEEVPPWAVQVFNCFLSATPDFMPSGLILTGCNAMQ